MPDLVTTDAGLRRQVEELLAENERLRNDLASRRRSDDATRRQREMLETIFDGIPVMIAYTGPSGRLELVNREFERIMGWTLTEIRFEGVDIYEKCFPDPKERERVLAFIAASEGKWEDFRPVTRDGRVIDAMWCRLRLSAGASIGFGQDMTERKRAEDLLRRSEAYLNESQRISHHGSWAWHAPTRRITYWSPEAYRIFDIEPGTDDRDGISSERIHPKDRVLIQNNIEAILRDRRAFDIEFRVVQRSGAIRHIRCTGHPVFDEKGELSEFVGTFVDMTERRKLERLQRNFSRQLVKAQESERRHIARELHDEIGQALTALKFELRLIEQTGRSAHESVEIADRALQQVRTLSLDLRPSVLDDFGLYSALRWYLHRHAERAGLAMHLSGREDDVRLPVELETVCFRVAQEAVTNIIRHARATNVWVELQRTPSRVRMTIRDDGVGFDTSAARQRALRGQSIGLLGMQERVALVGGRLRIDSADGAGCQVRVSLPLRDGDARAA